MSKSRLTLTQCSVLWQMSALWRARGPSSWVILLGHWRRYPQPLLGKATGNNLPPTHTHNPASLPLLGHFQLPCPSLPPGLSALHKSHQAKQEENKFHKIRHSANIYNAKGSCAGTFHRAGAPWLNHGSCLQPPGSASRRGCKGMVGKAEFLHLLIDTDACPAPNPPTHTRPWHKHQALSSPLLRDWPLVKESDHLGNWNSSEP